MIPRQSSGELYEVLGLDTHCTPAEISQRYRLLALRYHPDRNAGATVAEFQRIEEAHRVLTDPRQRQLYDTFGRKGMKQIGECGGGVLSSLLLLLLTSCGFAAGCFVVGLVAVAFFTSLLISCYKIDAPDKWPSWGLILLPVWCILPALVLISVTVLVVSLRHGTYILLIPSVRLLIIPLIATTTAAALDHRITPIMAFIPWTIWCVLGSVSDLVMLVPTVYTRTHSALFSEEEAADSSGNYGTGVQDSDPLLPPGGHRAGAMSTTESETTSHSRLECGAGNDTAHSQPWNTGRYWRQVTGLLFETVCLYAFLALAFQRALQREARSGLGGPRPRSEVTRDSGTAPSVLSFWVVLTPLIVYFGVSTPIAALEGYFVDSKVATSLSSETPVEDDTGTNMATPSASQEQQQREERHCRRLTSRDRLTSATLRALPAACGLYMTCMWAAKAEYEYNKRTSGPDPSAFLAFLPLLLFFGVLVLLVCCVVCAVMCIGTSCVVAEENTAATPVPTATPSPRTNLRASNTAAAVGDRQTEQKPVAGSTRDKGYNSTLTRRPSTTTTTTRPLSLHCGKEKRMPQIEEID
ncbi:hypothetical protein JKF63_07270 [Porcisia hertigi]|uniref:J domain-containing protein n=1 Tax=Porcisia hertigi TaxID=2761500 RepID=A0A836LLK9_9TRYP|nr:hypothetical protein JKF63_07270 [Porcisia hertigi]